MTESSAAPEPRTIHPVRQQRVRTALNIFTTSAWISGTMLILLMVRWIGEDFMGYHFPGWTVAIPIAHGWLYIAFLMATFNLGSKARLKPKTWLVIGLSAVVPFLSFVTERIVRTRISTKYQLTRSAAAD